MHRLLVQTATHPGASSAVFRDNWTKHSDVIKKLGRYWSVHKYKTMRLPFSESDLSKYYFFFCSCPGHNIQKRGTETAGTY